MTFEEFKTRRSHVEDLGRHIVDYGFEVVSGFIYPGGLHIEEDRFGGDAYFLTLGNDSTSSEDLETLERKLYDWAKDEGYFD